jgi:hypothetical protein
MFTTNRFNRPPEAVARHPARVEKADRSAGSNAQGRWSASPIIAK